MTNIDVMYIVVIVYFCLIICYLIIYMKKQTNRKILHDRIQEMLKYSQSLVGIKYRGWVKEEHGTTVGNCGPCWVSCEKSPSHKKLEKDGCNCIGVLNLMRRKFNLPIADYDPNDETTPLWYAGGIYSWFDYFSKHKKFVKFDMNKKWPIGTLLFRKYTDEIDQGHFAMIVTRNEKHVLFEKILHSFPTTNTIENKLTAGGIVIDRLGPTFFWEANDHQDFNGYFTHAVLPQNWLLDGT